MDGSAFRCINPGSGHIGMAQDVRQTGQVTLQGIVGAGKEVAQVVWEYLGWLHPGALAQLFHVPPDIAPVQGLSILADKHRSGGDFLFLEIGAEQFPQLVREKDGAALALVVYLGAPGLDGLGGDEAQLRYPDTCGANGLDDQGQALVFRTLGSLHQPDILGTGQLLVLGKKEGLLDFQFPQPQVVQAAKGKEPIDGSQLIIDAGRSVLADQVLLPLQQQALRHGFPSQKNGKDSQFVDILLDRGGAALLLMEKGSVFLDQRRGDGQILFFHGGILLGR